MPAFRQVFLPLALVAAAGCERLPQRGAARDASISAPADTVVRRVVRVFRIATAMQRVSGAGRALSALQPLDSTLTIRVLDQRGVEMGGVPVKWSLTNAGQGAQLGVINARTDSLGLARASFTPGLSADPQLIGAEVRNVGRIDFAVAVAATSLRIDATRTTLWSGEEETVAAQLADVAGHALAGGEVSWGSTDTAALRVRSHDPTHARVTGVLAGRTSLVAWIGAGTVRGSEYFTVRPVIAGRIVTIDGQPVPPMRMEVRAGEVRDSIAVVNGWFSERLAIPLETEVDVRAASTDASTYHPVHLRVMTQRELQDLRIALVPRTWRIDAGTYQGREMPIDALRAMQRTPRGAPFWRLAPISGSGPRTILGWRESDLPLRVAFDRSKSQEQITEEDSTQFWAIAKQMERDLGASVFAPAEMRDDTNARNVVSVEISPQVTEGHTFVSWGQPGDAGDGVLLLRHATTLRDSHVVTHELLHLLGFGHTGAWPTVSLPSGGREQRLTPEDVAYVQLAMRLRRIQRQTGARPGLPTASQ